MRPVVHCGSRREDCDNSQLYYRTEERELLATVVYPHIELRADGVPHLVGTQTNVVEIVLDRLTYHWDAEEIQREHPHLRLAQIYSALAYYHDHKAEIDHEIEEQLLFVEKIKAELGESPVRLKLKAKGLLP